MKVALVVFPLHYSHGCILQTFALYSKLKELGCEVTIFDRHPPKESLVTHFIKTARRIRARITQGYKGAVFFSGYYPKTIMSEQQKFIDLFKKDIECVFSTLELQGVIEKGKYDAIVVGSDQTWRPKNVPNVMDYWLEFANDLQIKKVAYAPSFGVDVWEYTEEQTKKCHELARKFDGISVREESGVKLCKDNLGVEALQVLDPTMLWDKSFYAFYAKQCPPTHGTLNCYYLDKSDSKNKIADYVAMKLGLNVVQINTRTEDSNAPVSERIAPSIERWLSGFYYGDFVIVDSFHAMVFSIIFETPFLVIGNSRRGLARFESLLSELGLQNRLVKEDTEDVAEIIKTEINWKDVKSRLDAKRDICLTFLINSLGILTH